MSTDHTFRFQVGEFVVKTGGDYTFEGFVVSVFRKRGGKIRYVVEDYRGILHIFSESNLCPSNCPPPPK